MSPELILVVAVITYASRAVGLAALPDMPSRVVAILDRMPSALFAGLAVQTLVIPGPEIAAFPVLAAAAGALLVTPLRSLPACLLAGIAAYGLAAILT
jgi:branched-subunit amino acid transport protein